jgi:carboxymethylenebutenolidase
MNRMRGGIAMLIVVTGIGCGGESAENGTAGGADAQAAPEMSSPRVALDPTADGALPPAILGTAPPLAGQSASYFPADPATVGYLAVPQGPGPFPALILVHEWNGLNDRVREMADAMAAEGYVALAADLYSGRTGSTPQENMALVNEVQGDSARVIANLDAAAEFLRARPDVSGKIGAMGWCFGGGIALSYGLGGKNHDATAIFYGRLVDDPETLRHISHEVYGTFAALDEGISPAAVDSFVAALREAGIPNDVHVYDDVNHGFWLHVDQRPQDRDAALDAWQRLKAYLDRTLR